MRKTNWLGTIELMECAKSKSQSGNIECVDWQPHIEKVDRRGERINEMILQSKRLNRINRRNDDTMQSELSKLKKTVKSRKCLGEN